MVTFAKSTVRLHLVCAFFAIGSFVWGYHVGVLSSVLVHPGFTEALGHPTAAQKGLVTAIYYLGTWFSYVFLSSPLADALGRRYAALAGTAIVAVGTGFEAGASAPSAYGLFVVGRIISGIGVAILSTSVPLYQSEVSPAAQRGRYVVLNHVGFVVGLAAGFWVGYAVTFWENNAHQIYVSWRFSIAIILIPCIIFASGLPFLPETPRWLVEHGHYHRAQWSLCWFREGSHTEDEIKAELAKIQVSVQDRLASRPVWLSLFTHRDLFDRLWRASLLQFMSQMCGATAMKYYLPTLLGKLGVPTRVTLLIGGIESTSKIAMTVVEMLIIDRVGRRTTLVTGSTAMGIGMLMNAVLGEIYPDNQNRAADIACIVFVFIYALGYSMGFGPASWVYGSEIFPTAVRARGLNLSASGGAIGSIVVAQVWPVGIDRIGSRIYFFFFAINVICIPIIFLFYPETKGRALEDIDDVFSKVLNRQNSHENEGQSEIAIAYHVDDG
ncbi:hypothetical protein G7054_g1217 [Neopestalotiopsis clavispora]|nr:hypothetical protein G7054_g1217 [Neopestalotiopsis clavispora]